MADLSTLDITKPLDTDAASAGASEIRTERADIVGWADMEHKLTGVHKIPAGSTASRPAVGNTGRLYINTDINALQYDSGSAWVTLGGGITKAFIANYNSLTLTGAFQDLVSTTITAVAGQWILVLGTCMVQTDNAGAAILNAFFRVFYDGAVELSPGQIQVRHNATPVGNPAIIPVTVPWAFSAPTAGSHTIKLQGYDIAATGIVSHRQIMAVAW